ncbi:PREDICTED: dehydrogenase/reductase SDR family member 4-like [Rhagoletis zephyria]|uniref:dehydrogenase/reductase SDR family member 4-like n=1 Tax=Rhagoletis zephyria TaxID=28612 RepID=UPI00081140FE|nr:PREDICTED: dehydrogenase/reductase SDR family member 4-like [Rhagoletis zephyria]
MANRLSLAVAKNLLLKTTTNSGAALRTFSSPAKKPISYNLEKKVAIVTASTDGIGLSIAQRLAQSGASVVVSSRKQANVDRTVADLRKEGLSVEGIVCHVGKDADRKALVNFTLEKFGGIDIFVSNAAVNPGVGMILETEEEVWDKIFDINVKAAMLLTKEIVPHMEKREGTKAIVYNASIGAYQIFPVLSTYSVSKTALLGLTKAVAAQCAPLNIRVNAVCPGVVQTKFASAITTNPEAAEEALRPMLMKRLGVPDDIGGVVTFLCSDDASYMTGESIVAAGGLFSRL